MRLRTQNSIVILPLLLGAISIMGISRYVSERHEMMWGARSEIEALAVSLAEFINPAYLEQLTGGESKDPDTVRHLLTPLQRVYDSKLLRHLAIYSGDGKRLLYQRGERGTVATEDSLEESLPALRALLSYDLFDTGTADRAVVRQSYYPADENRIPVLCAFAPVSDGSGVLAAVVAVETDVSHIGERSQGIITHVGKIGLAVALLGIAAVLLLSAFVVRPIQTLTVAFREALKEGKRRWLGFLRIQEFQELGDAYNTMISVIDEADHRISQNLMQEERHRTREGLRVKYAEEFYDPIYVSTGAFTACGRTIGPAGRDFLDVQSTPQKLLAVTGILSGKDESVLFLGASSLGTLVRSYLDRDDTAQVYDILSSIYSIDFFHCVEVDLETCQFQIWLQGLGAEQLITWQGRLAPGESIVIHTFTGEAAHRIGIYQRHFSTMPPDQLMEQILGALGEEFVGAIAVVKNERASAAA